MNPFLSFLFLSFGLLVLYPVIFPVVRSYILGSPIGLWAVLGLRMRRSPVGKILNTYYELKKLGLEIDIYSVEAHYLAGGDVYRALSYLKAARDNGHGLSWDRACVADLLMQSRVRSWSGL